jgi:hypothetical protein
VVSDCSASDIVYILSKHRFFFSNEKQLQEQIGNILSLYFKEVKREYRLNEKSIIDFFISGIGIEIKTKGSAQDIYRQCKRYCEFDKIKSLILIGTRNYPISDFCNKKVVMFNIGMMAL